MVIVAVVLVAVVLFVGFYFGRLLVGGATLRVGFQPEPPWQVKLSGVLNFTFYVTNDGPGIARDISVSFLMPSGFIDSDTGTNQNNIQSSRIFPGDAVTYWFRILVSSQIALGSHTFTIKVTCANAPEQLINPEVRVLKT